MCIRDSFRVEVGRSHGAGPGNIVGAIANEAGLQNGQIGKIKMFDRHSFIDLPVSLGEDILDVLRNVHVSGQRLQIARAEKGAGRFGGDRSHRRRSNNGSTDFSKRNQKPYRGRKSISRSEGFGGNDSGSSSKRSGGYKGGESKSTGYKAKPNSLSTKARLKSSGKSSSGESKSFEKPARKSKPAKAKATKKYIKVRTKK